MRIPCWLLAVFALPTLLASDVGNKGKTLDQKRLVSDSLINLVLTKLPTGFSLAIFSVKTSRITHSTPPLLGSRRGLGFAGFRWSYADNLGVAARGADCANFLLARLIAGVQKASLDIHDTSPASGSADLLGYEFPANSYCNGMGKRISRIRCRTLRSLRGVASAVGQWSSLALTNLGALSILDASFTFSRAS